MKRILALFLFNIILFTSVVSFGAPVDFAGGVHNEYEYEELVFITGEPIKFVGEVDIKEKIREKDNTKTTNYKITLHPEDTSIEGKLTRKITYVTEYTEDKNKGQSIGQTSVTKYSESINIDDDKYKLEDYQFSKSDVIDNRPATYFYTGNIKGRKYYSLNKNEGKIIIDITGGNVGYENFWGSTETQKVNQIITYPDGKQGIVKTQTSDSLTKKLVYSDNDVNLISFDGGYVRTTNQEVVSRYDYSLPAGEGRNKTGTKNLSKKMSSNLERLIVPKFRDVPGHWAEEYIEKLYSLDVFDDKSMTFFVPEGPITRKEYIVAVMKASDIEPEIPVKKSRRKAPKEVSPFSDVSIDDKDYYYIKEAYDIGIINGRHTDLFRPKETLTVAEGVTMIIRALGFETKAPTPGYYTKFSDDREIPSWAKDSVYVAKEIGILKGNKLNPNKPLSRAEASQLLVNFLEFLEKDLQKDYRENIILFN